MPRENDHQSVSESERRGNKTKLLNDLTSAVKNEKSLRDNIFVFSFNKTLVRMPITELRKQSKLRIRYM